MGRKAVERVVVAGDNLAGILKAGFAFVSGLVGRAQRAREFGADLREPVTVYKLTDEAMTTLGGCQWRLNEWRETSGQGPLCGPGWLHVYRHPDYAILLNLIHGGFHQPRLFRADAGGVMLAEALKAGVSRLALREELPVPTFTPRERAAWAIFAVRAMFDREPIPAWERWATKFLAGADAAAELAADAAAAHAAYAVYVAARAPCAAKAAYMAAKAAYMAAKAAARTSPLALSAALSAAEAVEAAAEAEGVEFDLDAVYSQFRSWRKEAQRGSRGV